jgi:hypothetical protein
MCVVMPQMVVGDMYLLVKHLSSMLLVHAEYAIWSTLLSTILGVLNVTQGLADASQQVIAGVAEVL